MPTTEIISRFMTMKLFTHLLLFLAVAVTAVSGYNSGGSSTDGDSGALIMGGHSCLVLAVAAGAYIFGNLFVQ